MDRLTSLTVFVRVVDSGGFSAAARRLNMSTTMVSNHVQALEDRLGVRLLNRTTRKVSLTEVGEAYYERCTQILADLEEADRIAGALQSTPRGTLRLYTAHPHRPIPRAGRRRVPGARIPEVAVELTIGERMSTWSRRGSTSRSAPTPPPDSSLIVRRLATWRHVLCCSPGYLEEHRTPAAALRPRRAQLPALCRYPFGDEWRFADRNGEPASVRVSGNLVTNSGETLRRAALAGAGIFLAPGFLVADDLEVGRLVRLLPEYRPVEFAINAIYPHRHHLSAKVRGFIDLLVRHAAEQQKLINPYS